MKDEAPNKNNGLTTTLSVCAVVMALGLVVAWNYMIMVKNQSNDADYLPNMQSLEKDLRLTNQSGAEVSFHQLRGKVWVLGYVFTRCPVGCVGLMERMSDLQEMYGKNPNFHLAAVTMDPKKDTPEFLAEWTKEKELGGDNWWFMTGDGKRIRTYMSKYFRAQISKRTDPQEIELYGEWEHELKLMLVDRNGMVRYHYTPLDNRFGEQHWEKLQKDVKRLLDDPTL